ncbi:PREDICTED: flocculation protein FLO11 [Trachymyrmex septentrionalis]|uniref:flocculation protein FLO11 n=1 Tax=Trachymyrmex septentrionalis TaxID=34720 RepID=UPI00084F10B8|nr:PREDICTED: flocculation protein FLO11 [Trachymyrmex septentrionalis]
MTSRYFVFVAALAYVAVSAAQVYNSHSEDAVAAIEPAAANNDFITQTVYGFLDFTTTIGNTVMVFSPQSAPPEGGVVKKITSPTPAIHTKPTTEQQPKKNIPDIQPSKTHKAEDQGGETKKQIKGTKVVVNSVVEQNVVNPSENTVPKPTKNQESNKQTKTPTLSSVVQVRAKDETPGVKNNLAEPEYDFLSKQPTEVIDETYKLINLRPSSKVHHKPRATPRRDKENPTGLVTKLGGTIVKDGLTTVHETSVIGTYINGKYAQVLQSSSRILTAPVAPVADGKIRPSSTNRILKTIGPQHGKLKPQLEPTPTHQQQDESSLPLEALFNEPSDTPIRSTRKPSTPNNLTKPKFRNKIADEYDNNEPQQTRIGKNRSSTSRPNYKNRPATTTTEAPITRRRSGFRPNSQSPNTPSKQLTKSKNSDQQPSTTISLLPKVKLPRTQGRWSYKTTPKPRIMIRKQVDEEDSRTSTESSTTELVPGAIFDEQGKTSATTATINVAPISSSGTNVAQRKELSLTEDELDPSESEDVASVSIQQDQQHPGEQILPVETLNVEISTAADLDNVYFEIATIKSPYSFQVGTLRNTRYITVTSTIKKTFATAEPSSSILPTEPLTENILANTGAAYESTLPLDSSIATLPAISLDAAQATPPLETLTETFSTTQTLLKTHMLPIIYAGNSTTRLTLVQTYNIARVVTATKTLPPMEIYQFIPSKTLNEFNSKLDEAGSELHLELDFGDDDRDDEDVPKRVVVPNNDSDADLDIFKSASPSKIKSDAATSSNAEPQLTPEQAQQLALLKYFGQPQLQVITTSKPVITLETLYESHVIPVVNSGNTIYSTLTRPVGTVPKTSYEYGTSTLSPVLPQVQQVPQLPLFPQQPQFTVTSAPIVTQTLATVSDSRVLKLTFGAKTAYTTLFSTRVVPTELTTYITNTVPVQPTVPAYPGYYPAPVPYPPFPFVG